MNTNGLVQEETGMVVVLYKLWQSVYAWGLQGGPVDAEVIREALRVLDEYERARFEALRAAIAVGYAQAERGEARPLTSELSAEMDRNVARKFEAGQRPKADVLP